MKKIRNRVIFIAILIAAILAACSQPDMTVNEVLYPFFKVVLNPDTGDWEVKVIAGSNLSTVTVPDNLKNKQYEVTSDLQDRGFGNTMV